ncbi:hypothetical protein COV06_01635 [Candidatus Uhrbacteria bacterium CG10_big_fil_rev_8_21_14_0_10_50_16]|uniref:Peptidyl-prolyl cis-trans isomerase n=1 Tax=Candidatus Uhrbacteria bacterium CG10_big_fil_rev_8_21_14_0_10_50_16 TaxID=1975039 RepID=A0A2H0RQT7_9BACT|nr:MAG: hypothetical protein COV06_01635 [Candidatus Uhrbacteria bacterium CG10_big_fil_rev_8_21_14_0_10_50_16]
MFVGAGCVPASVEEPIELQVEPNTVPMEEPVVEPVTGDVSLSDFTAPPTAFPGILVEAERVNRSVVLHTDKGDVTIALYGDEAPAAVSNFLILANTGFYDGVRFHRIIKDFMIQTGDPQSKDVNLSSRWGMGGPGYQFPDELGRGHNTYQPGTLAMANSGSNTNGSQFFIMHGNTPLPNLYTIFGQVTDGMDVVNMLATVETSGPPSDKPLTPPVIKSIEILPVE